MDASLGLLLERLRWPILRVRWEAARALAVLIRAGANGALDGLLEWTTNRTLESECLLGLSVIHAFELGDSCPEATVRKAVSKPSLTSDWMLRTIYDMFSRSMSFRSAISPQHVVVDEETASFFDHLNTMAVPPAFLCTLISSKAGRVFHSLTDGGKNGHGFTDHILWRCRSPSSLSDRIGERNARCACRRARHSCPPTCARSRMPCTLEYYARTKPNTMRWRLFP